MILTLQHGAPSAERLWERGAHRGVRGNPVAKSPSPCPSRRLGHPPRPEQLQKVVGKANHLPLRLAGAEAAEWGPAKATAGLDLPEHRSTIAWRGA